MASPAPRPAPAPQRAPSRVSLAKVVTGRLEQPIRVLLYSVEGCGKSTFASNAPSPVFVGAEDGTAHLDVHRLGPPDMTWQDIKDCVHVLRAEPHDYRSFVLDTADWAEPLLWRYICERDGVSSIEEYGFGKGYAAALDEWRVFLASLDVLRAQRKMHIVLLAHSWIRPFKNPEGEDFDRYELKLNQKASGLLKEWSDCVLFANYETHAVKDTKTKRVRGVDTGARMMYTQRRAAYDAKNRYDLPEAMPLSWPDFEAAVRAHRPADPAELKKAIAEKKVGLDAATLRTADDLIARAGDDAVKLSQLNDWINGKLALAPAKETT